MNKALMAVRAILEKRNFVFLPLVIISVFMLILLNYYTIKVISTARAYINGESRYSKSQKDASAHLINYVYRSDPSDYQLFLQELSVPLGDRQARVNLMRGEGDQLIREGLLKGKNDPADIADMVWLFNRFHRLDVFKQALRTWETADALVDQLRLIGAAVHRSGAVAQITEPQKRMLVDRINALSGLLTAQEKEFSDQFGVLSRKVDRYIFSCNCLLTLIIFGCLLGYADMMIRKLARLNHTIAEKNERLDQMMYTVTHDLRSPLATVSGLISLLEEEPDEADRARYLSLMKSCISRQDEFISAMLNAVAEQESVRECDLVQLVNAIRAQHYLDAAGRPVDFRTTLEVTRLTADPLQLQLIFNNLVSNAIKYFDYSRTDRVAIGISARREGEQCVLAFRDNGIGIAKAHQRKIFDKFFMSRKNRSSTGLGLYLVREAVKELNGHIEVQSEPGQGSTFTVTIPIFLDN